MSLEREPVDMTKPGDRDEVYVGMRAAEKRIHADVCGAMVKASGDLGWAPERACRLAWWLETLTREQAAAIITAYYDAEDARRGG